MAKDKRAIQYNEGQQVLFEGSCKAIPFNALMAFVLIVFLIGKSLPLYVGILWLSVMFIISLIRLIHCKVVLRNGLFKKKNTLHLRIFLFLTSVMGLAWTSIFFMVLPYSGKPELYLILMLFGAMAGGSTANLGVYLPAFYAFVLGMFLPVVLYYYSLFTIDNAIFATMALFFLMAIALIAKSHNKLFANVFYLTEQNKVLKEKFENLSITDSLTGLFNRRHFTKVLNEEYNRCKRNKQSFAIVSIDVDNFKLINDNLGHPFGDQFLKYMASYLRYYLKRANDMIFRIGGDEFIAILINNSEQNTKETCKNIKDEFLKNPNFDYTPRDSMRENVLAEVTLSMGILYVPFDTTADIDSIIAMADQLLYQSKHEGKNMINYRKCQ